VPVAKRNFRNRHKHGNLFEKGKKENEEETPHGLANEEEEGEKEKVSAAITKLPLLEGGEKPPLEESEDVKLSSAPQSEEEATVMKVPFAAAATDPQQNIGTVSVSSMHNATKVQKWVELLENKPATGDKQAMAIWMLNLMNATDSSESSAVASPAKKDPAAEAKTPASNIASSQDVKLPVVTAAGAKDSPANKGMATSILEGGNYSTSENNQEEEDRVKALISKAGAKRSEDIKQENGEDDSSSSGLTQPPKKKFKQEYEEVWVVTRAKTMFYQKREGGHQEFCARKKREENSVIHPVGKAPAINVAF